MSKIIIKTPEEVLNLDGEVSMTIEKIKVSDKEEIVCSGVLSVYPYMEEIIEIITDRVTLSDIDIFREDYGTKEEHIIYSFIAKE